MATLPNTHPITGTWNINTRKVWQLHLKWRGYYTGLIDGDWGPMSRKAVQRDLKRTGYYTGLIDGDWGSMTLRALHFFLHTHWGSYNYLGRSHQSQMYVAPWSPTRYFAEEVCNAIQSGLRRHGWANF